jgi:hypothetical protein
MSVLIFLSRFSTTNLGSTPLARLMGYQKLSRSNPYFNINIYRHTHTHTHIYIYIYAPTFPSPHCCPRHTRTTRTFTTPTAPSKLTTFVTPSLSSLGPRLLRSNCIVVPMVHAPPQPFPLSSAPPRSHHYTSQMHRHPHLPDLTVVPTPP